MRFKRDEELVGGPHRSVPPDRARCPNRTRSGTRWHLALTVRKRVLSQRPYIRHVRLGQADFPIDVEGMRHDRGHAADSEPVDNEETSREWHVSHISYNCGVRSSGKCLILAKAYPTDYSQRQLFPSSFLGSLLDGHLVAIKLSTQALSGESGWQWESWVGLTTRPHTGTSETGKRFRSIGFIAIRQNFPLSSPPRPYTTRNIRAWT